MAEEPTDDQREQPKYGRAGDAPNSLQRWLLSEASTVSAACMFAATLTGLAVIFSLARGGRFTVSPFVLVPTVWLVGTAVIACLLALSGWSENRAERTVKYLPPFPWSRDK